jgi:hypothetical protein
MTQIEYSPNKTSICFDSLHSEYLKEANMGHPRVEGISRQSFLLFTSSVPLANTYILCRSNNKIDMLYLHN